MYMIWIMIFAYGCSNASGLLTNLWESKKKNMRRTGGVKVTLTVLFVRDWFLIFSFPARCFSCHIGFERYDSTFRIAIRLSSLPSIANFSPCSIPNHKSQKITSKARTLKDSQGHSRTFAVSVPWVSLDVTASSTASYVAFLRWVTSDLRHMSLFSLGNGMGNQSQNTNGSRFLNGCCPHMIHEQRRARKKTKIMVFTAW